MRLELLTKDITEIVIDTLNGGRFEVWYSKKETFRDLVCGYEIAADEGTLPVPRRLDRTHGLLGTVHVADLDAAFAFMQAENWSPDGEGRPYVEAAGSAHTSMCVGDVLFDRVTRDYFFCDNFGWKKLDDPLKD